MIVSLVRVMALAFVLAMLGVAVSPASGDFGSTPPSRARPPQQVSLANNDIHRVDFHSTTSATGGAMKWALNRQFPRLGFGWHWVDGTNHDVRISDFRASNNLLGWVNCPNSATERGRNPNRWCYGQRLNVNLRFSLPPAGKRYLACHELGHTVGLRHETELHSDSCMRVVRDTTPSYSMEDVYAVRRHY